MRIYESVKDIPGETLTAGQFIQTKGNQEAGDGGGRSYWIQTLADYGGTPDGEVIGGVYVGGDWLLANNNVAKMQASETTVNPKWFGYRGLGVIPNGIENPTLDPTIDESDAIEKMVAWINNNPGSPQDLGKFSSGDPKSKAGAYSIQFPARSICNISRTMFTPFVRTYCTIDFNNTEVRPLSPIPAIYKESFLTEIKNLVVRYDLEDQDLPVNQQDGSRSGYLTWEEIYNGAQAGYETTCYGIAIQGDRPGQAVDSFTTYKNIVVFGGWRAINSDGNDILFGDRFEKVNAQRCMDWGFVMESSGIGTTCVLERCWSECIEVDTVQNNGNTYIPVQHIPASPVIEPGVTSGWEDFWFQSDPTLDPPASFPQWVSGKFYRTFGKGYFISNQSTVSMIQCAMDGGSDVEPGNVINLNQRPNLNIDNFHLERHFKLYSDRASMLIRLGNFSIDNLYLADPRYRIPGQISVQNGGVVYRCRVNHTSDSTNEPGVGAEWYTFWEEQNVINVPPTIQPAWTTATDYVNGTATMIGGIFADTVTVSTIEEVTLEVLPPAVNPVKKWINNEGIVALLLGTVPTGQLTVRNASIQYPNSRIDRINDRFNVAITNWTFKPDWLDSGNIIRLQLNAAGTYTAVIDDPELEIGTNYEFHLQANGAGGSGTLAFSFPEGGELFPANTTFAGPAARGFRSIKITKEAEVSGDGRWFITDYETT